ncbi:MAG TPA: ATP-binding protein [Rhodocyclaceae bacterium]|nr:ATP-binding protein [Rhodocyclaceae bacterium]
MTLSEQRPMTLSDAWFERLGIGIVIVHGHTVVRASTIATRMLDRADTPTIGRELHHLFALADADRLKTWLQTAYTDIEQSKALAVSIDTEGGNARRFRLTSGPLESGSANARVIAIEEQMADNNSANSAVELRRTFKELLDGNPVPTFVVNNQHMVLHWNRACEILTGVPASDIVGTRNQWKPFYEKERPVLADLVVDGTTIDESGLLYNNTLTASAIITEGLEASNFYPKLGNAGCWLLITAGPIRNSRGAVVGAIETLVDITEIKRAEVSLRQSQQALEDLVGKRTAELERAKRALEGDIARRELAEKSLLDRYAEMANLNFQLSEANDKLQSAQNQLLQNEKLASIGQLAAGVAHEINNPIGYVFSNFGTLEKYVNDIFTLVDAYCNAEAHIGDEALQRGVKALREKLDIEFLKEDTHSLMAESREGIERVRKIVQDLKDFSHVDADASWQWTDLHKGIDSTLNIVNNEIKYHADVVKEYGQIPKVQCLPSQLNQVFMNLLVNAAHAMEGRSSRGAITVSTGSNDTEVWIAVSDMGCGMSEETRKRIFDPFFTTKPIGKGTGLGLSLSYGIVQKHHGTIEVTSTLGEGTRFCVTLPIRQSDSAMQEAA